MERPLDPRRAESRVHTGLARAEQAQRAANMAAAEQWHFMSQVLEEARCAPDLYVDPAFDLRWEERVAFAVRGAVSDLAVRLSIAEGTVREQAFAADTLRGRLPRTWTAFCEGDVAVANARAAADLVRTLPDEASAAFDDAVIGISRLAPARFRQRARVLRERIHSTSLTERVTAARETRGVWIENDVDGMAELLLRLPAEVAHAHYNRIDSEARTLAKLPGEIRTLMQLRADVAAELSGAGRASGSRGSKPSVGVLVPVMTLLGHSDEPAILEGYGPLDAETARRLAARAPSFTRILTHPITGDILGVDRGTYRPPADLRRWMQIVDQTCAFTGCGRPARKSDLDHTDDAQYGGATRAGNLAHLCRHHHRLKHNTRFAVRQTGETGGARLEWTTPTGYRVGSDPPPF